MTISMPPVSLVQQLFVVCNYESNIPLVIELQLVNQCLPISTTPPAVFSLP